MSREPSYPKDAAVGGEAEIGGGREEQAPAAPAPGPEGPKRNKHLMAGAAIGIGSAAIVAALLYANRKSKGDR